MDTDTIKDAKDVVSECESMEGDNRTEAEQDIRFRAGEQWDELWMRHSDRVRMKKAALTVNQLSQYLNQVINDIRQNRPAIKARPVDDKADIKLADIFEGIIRHAQDQGKADTARDIAMDHAVTHGLGWYRMLTDYVDPMSFDQEPVYQGIDEPFNVYHDDFRQPDGSDLKRLVIVSGIRKSDFEKQYPKFDAVSWQDDEPKDDAEALSLAEFYCIKTRTDAVLMLADGRVILESEAKRRFEAGEELPRIVRERPTEVPVVYWKKLTGDAVLEERELIGSFIPVFPVVGTCLRKDGKPVRFGLIRHARDPQRYYNWLKSAEVEYLENAPKAPWTGPGEAFAPYKQYWEQSNEVNYSYLPWAHRDANGELLPEPKRNPPAPIPPGLMQAELTATDDIKKSLGMYSAAIGARGNATSGKQELAQQREADVGTFHYSDNLGKTVLHEGRVLMQWIPKLYGQRQVARIIGMDGEPKTVRLTKALPQAVSKVQLGQGPDQRIERIYNLGVGKYDVTVSVGPSYTTKRQEAAAMMTEMVRADNTLMAKAGDIIIRNYDIPGGEELAKRLKAFLPPQILQAEQEDDEQNPEALRQAQMQVQQAQAALQQRAEMLQKISTEMEKKDQQLSVEGQKVAAERAQLAADKQVLEARAREIEAKLALKARDARDQLEEVVRSAQPEPQQPTNPFEAEARDLENKRRDFDHAREIAGLQMELAKERAQSAIRPLAEKAGMTEKPEPEEAEETPSQATQVAQAASAPAPEPIDLTDIKQALAELLRRPVFDPAAVASDVKTVVRQEVAKAQKAIGKQIEDARTVRVEPVMDEDGNVTGGTIVTAGGERRKVELEAS